MNNSKDERVVKEWFGEDENDRGTYYYIFRALCGKNKEDYDIDCRKTLLSIIEHIEMTYGERCDPPKEIIEIMEIIQDDFFDDNE